MLDGMTNIKASEVLIEVKYYAEDLAHYSADDVAEALEMAIKALQPKPMEKFDDVKTHIQRLAGDYKCWDNRLTWEEALELNRMLEAQPCEDCISRKEVIDIINFEDKWLFDAKSHNADTKIAFSGLKSKVKALQPVTPTQRWIPVSERLPEKGGDYLVTIKWKGSYSGDVYTETNMAVYKEKEKEWDCAGIVAWMPLPLPYAPSN